MKSLTNNSINDNPIDLDNLDFSTLSLEELRKLQDKIEKEKEKIIQSKIEQYQKFVSRKLECLTDEDKKLILSLIDHYRTSCSDDNPCNGIILKDNTLNSYTYRCKKCALMEIFNNEWGGSFDFKLEPIIIDTSINYEYY